MDRRTSDAGTQPDVLLVEDNPGDVRLVEEALCDADVTLHLARDGREALDFLHRRGEWIDAPRPDTVLLDLNLPRVDGDEVLEEIRSTADLEGVRVVVLTSAREEYTAIGSTEHDPDHFITKPAAPDEFIDRIRSSLVE